MGVLDKDGKRPNRRPALKGMVMVDVVEGVERVRAWPSPRKTRITAQQRAQMEWFRQAQKATKYLAPQLLADANEATNPGPILPRDILTMMFANRLISIIQPNGTEIFPMAVYRDVSESLDAISQTPGYTLRRGVELWEGQPPVSGQLLGASVDRTTNLLTGAAFSYTNIPFTSQSFDQANFWDAAAPTRLTIPFDGWFLAQCWVTYSSPTGSARGAAASLNGIQIARSAGDASTAFNQPTRQVVAIFHATAGQYLEFQVHSGNANINSTEQHASIVGLAE